MTQFPPQERPDSLINAGGQLMTLTIEALAEAMWGAQETQLVGYPEEFLPFARAVLAKIDETGLLQQEWQPIETAPKDGRRFLAGRFTGKKVNHDGLVQVDRWHNRERGDSYDGLGKFNSTYWPATHWMPLLPAPKGDDR